MKKQDGFGHEKPGEGETNDWITPKWLIDEFDSLTDSCYFDLDPCISLTQPWLTAREGYCVEQNGLIQPWFGTVWCNPPYGGNISVWAEKMALHNDGIMLIFARNETEAWQDVIFPSASSVCFLKRRLIFYYPDGTPAKNKKGQISSAGAPSALISFGDKCASTLLQMLELGKIDGTLTNIRYNTTKAKSLS